MDISSLLTYSELFLDKARSAYQVSNHTGCREHLRDLYDFLDDEFGSKAKVKCESTESSDGS